MVNATTAPAPAPPKRRRWLRILGWLLLTLILLLLVVYFVATSSPFFKGVILPKVSKAMNATITVSDAGISPFSHVVLRDLKVQTTKEPRRYPAVTGIVHGRFDLMDGPGFFDAPVIRSRHWEIGRLNHVCQQKHKAHCYSQHSLYQYVEKKHYPS